MSDDPTSSAWCMLHGKAAGLQAGGLQAGGRHTMVVGGACVGGQRKDMPAGSTGPADDISDGLPGEVRPLFHNYDADTIDASRDAAWIILTVLSRGDWDQVGWLFRTYGWARIEAVVRDDIAGLQTLPRVVANFWSVVFWGRTLPPRPFRERWAATRRVSGVTRGDGR